MRAAWVLAGFLALAACNEGQGQVEWVSRVYDGDTLTLKTGERIRLKGIDAPEIKGQCPYEREKALLAKMTLEDATRNGVILERDKRLDKHGRTLAIVRSAAVPSRSINQDLVSMALARPYDGRGPRQGWC